MIESHSFWDKETKLEQELSSYRSGSKIKKLHEDYEAVISSKDAEIKRLKMKWQNPCPGGYRP